jgi:hypothetical protein
VIHAEVIRHLYAFLAPTKYQEDLKDQYSQNSEIDDVLPMNFGDDEGRLGSKAALAIRPTQAHHVAGVVHSGALTQPIPPLSAVLIFTRPAYTRQLCIPTDVYDIVNDA